MTQRRAEFLTDLDIRRRKGGNTHRFTLAPLEFYSALLDRTIVVPAGFEYDGVSVPRWLTAAYALLREKAELAGAVHDWLYAHPDLSMRSQADAVFAEACEAEGVPGFERGPAWAAVRALGWIFYGRDKAKASVPDPDPMQPLDQSPGG